MQVIDWEIFSMLISNKRLNSETQKLLWINQKQATCFGKGAMRGWRDASAVTSSHHCCRTQSSGPSTYTRQLTTLCNSNSRNPMPLAFVTLHSGAHIHMQIHRNTYLQVDTQEHMSTRGHIGTHAYMWIHRNTHIPTRGYTGTHTHMRIHRNTYPHADTQEHIPTYIHMYN